MLNDGANRDDIISYLKDRNLPADEITLEKIADLVFTQKTRIRLSDDFKCFTMEITIFKNYQFKRKH